MRTVLKILSYAFYLIGVPFLLIGNWLEEKSFKKKQPTQEPAS